MDRAWQSDIQMRENMWTLVFWANGFCLQEEDAVGAAEVESKDHQGPD